MKKIIHIVRCIQKVCVIVLLMPDGAISKEGYQSADYFGQEHPEIMARAVDIAVHENKVYLLDDDRETSKVFRFNFEGTLLDSILVGTANTIAIDQEGFIFVGDSRRGEVRKYSEMGQFIQKWGERGRGNGQFVRISEIFIDHRGLIYVNDPTDCHIQSFSGEGFLFGRIGFIPFKSAGICMNGLLVDKEGFYYGSDYIKSNHLIKIDKNGEIAAKWDFQGIPLCLGNSGRIYARSEHQISKLTPNGTITFQWKVEDSIDRSIAPIQAAMSENGLLYILDIGRGTIQTFYFPDEDMRPLQGLGSVSRNSDLNEAIELYKKERFRSARRLLKNRLHEKPNDGFAHYYLGLCYVANDKSRLAMNMFRKSIVLEPELGDAYYQMGLIAQEKENDEEALRYFEKCTEYIPRHSSANFELARLLFDKQEFDRSRQAFKLAYAFPNMLNKSDLFSLSIILGQNELVTFRKPLGDRSVDIDDYLDYFLLEHYRPYSFAGYKKTLDFFRLLFTDGMLFREKLRSTEEYLTRAIQTRPNTPHGYLLLGKAYYYIYLLSGDPAFRDLSQKQFEKGIKYGRQLTNVRDYNDFAELNYILGLISISKEEFNQALAFLRTAELHFVKDKFFFSMLPPNWKDLINFYIGACYEKTGNYENAVENYRKSIESHLLHIAPHIRIGSIFLARGKIEAAIQEWKAPGISFKDWQNYGHPPEKYELFATRKQPYSKYECAYAYSLISKAYIQLYRTKGHALPREVTGYLKKAIEITENSELDFHMLLAEVHFLNNESDLAITLLSEALNLAKKDTDRERIAQQLESYQKTIKGR